MRLGNVFNLDLASEYKIHELIFINSGSNYYTRLPVDTHAALLSDNNSGKTSTLSALKLFLLPEVNFKDCKTKFGFASGGKYYANLDSFQYYFPGSESYIICNASNPKQNFCWILYRTTDLGYERMAVPCPYDEIEHLFWNSASSRNENAGQHQPDITLSTLRQRLKKEYGGQVFSDRSVIGEAIYTRTSAADDHTRFSLLPMVKKFSSASVDTVRALLGMAFSLSNASTTTLPSAIGSIIDGMGMSVVKKNDDGIFLDLDNALDEWRQLKTEDSYLGKIATYRKQWLQLEQENSRYLEQRKSVQVKFQTVVSSVYGAVQELSDQKQVVEEEARGAEATLNNFAPQFREAKQLCQQTTSDLKSCERQLAHLEHNLQKADFVRGRLHPLCPDDDKSDAVVLRALAREREYCEQEIQALNDDGQAIALMERLSRAINDNQEKVVQLEKALHKLASGHSLFDHLSHHAASALSSLNPDFARLDLSIDHQQRHVIEQFTALFTNDDHRLLFCGAELAKTRFQPQSRDQDRRDITSHIEQLTDQIKDNQDQLHRLHKNTRLSASEQRQRLEECQQERAEFDQEREALEGALPRKKLLEQERETRAQLVLLLEQQTANLDEAQNRYATLRLAHDHLRGKVQNLNTPLERAEQYRRELEQMEAKSLHILDVRAAQANQESEPLQSVDFQSDALRRDLDGIHAQLVETLAARKEAGNLLALLLEHGIVDSLPEERHALSTRKQTFDNYYEAIRAVYDNLDSRRESYQQRLRDHNNHAAITARMIEDVKGVVESFVDKLNQELGGYTISNLDKVELVADLHPQYVDMAATLGRVANRADALLSEEFYSQIAAFQQQFYMRRSGKIDITSIIEKVSYRFNRNGTPEAIPQSNGTNCMINAVLLALLLKHMIPEDLNLSMPVIFDEVGSLDERNLNEVLKVMNEHGLVLFAANPEPTGVIASVLSVYHDLSIFKATDVEVQGKAEAIYFPGMEERLENIGVESGGEGESEGDGQRAQEPVRAVEDLEV